jgi:hypothetical protein
VGLGGIMTEKVGILIMKKITIHFYSIKKLNIKQKVNI